MGRAFQDTAKEALGTAWVQLTLAVATVVGLVAFGMSLQATITNGNLQGPKIVVDGTSTEGTSSSSGEKKAATGTQPLATSEDSPVETAEGHRPTPLGTPLLHSDSAAQFGEISMATITYEDGVWFDGKFVNDLWAEFRIDKKYSTFVGVVGYLDSAASDQEMNLIITNEDGEILYEKMFSLGEAETIELDIANYQRLRFEAQRGWNGGGNAIGVTGTFTP